jgi:hypothetical protein
VGQAQRRPTKRRNADDGPHDIEPITLKTPSGATVRGVVVLISRKRLVWYEIPADPTRDWIRREIDTVPVAAGQSGMAIGDVAGHGRPDIMRNRAETTSRFVWGTVSVASFNAKPQAPAQVQAPNFHEPGRRLRLAVKQSGKLFRTRS